MVRTEMLSRVRTLIDEVGTASFWLDTEIYSALTDAQQEVANYFYKLYSVALMNSFESKLPQPLESLAISVVATLATAGVAKPVDYWHIISVTYANTGGLNGTFYPCRIEKINPALGFNLANTYLAPSITDPKVYEAYSASLQLWFSPAPSGTGAYSLTYLKTPTAISASVDPILPVQTHSAIVHWATAQMLFKDQRPEEAHLHLQNFINELQMIG
jgi:hypothetical protein